MRVADCSCGCGTCGTVRLKPTVVVRLNGRPHDVKSIVFDQLNKLFDEKFLNSANVFRDEFKEELHPRESNGRFTAGAGHSNKVGKNDKHFAEKGVTGEHKLNPTNPKSKSIPKGMTVNEYILAKHGGDKIKALSWLKHFHNNGEVGFDAPINSSGQKVAAKPAPPVEVPSIAGSGKQTPLTKGKNAIEFNKLGITGEHVLHAKLGMKSIPKGMTISEYIAQKHAGDEGKALSWLKYHQKNGNLSILPPGGATPAQETVEAVVKAVVAGTPLGANLGPNMGLTASQVAHNQQMKALLKEQADKQIEAQSSKIWHGYGPDHVISSNTEFGKSAHGKTLLEYANSLKHPSAVLTAGHISKTVKMLADPSNPQKAKILPPGTDVNAKPESDNELVKAGLGPDHVLSINKPSNIPGNSLKNSHGKTIGEYLKSTGLPLNDAVNAIKSHFAQGNLTIHKPGTKVPPQVIPEVPKPAPVAQPAIQGKWHWGEADYDREHGTNSLPEYLAHASRHYKPSTYEERNAVEQYVDSPSVNDILREYKEKGKDISSESYIQDYLKHLDSFTNNSTLKSDYTLNRGFSSPKLYSQLEKLKPGDHFNDGGYVSTSTMKGGAGFGPAGNRIIVRAKAGARGGFMGKLGLSHEHEVLLPRDAKLKYAGRSKEGHFVFDHDT